jgi:hypothetical protein
MGAVGSLALAADGVLSLQALPFIVAIHRCHWIMVS